MVLLSHMKKEQLSDLIRARELFSALRLQEAYPLFRRFFDQLPFNPVSEHAENFGLFIRVLYELGKEEELNFYQRALEKLYRENETTELGYQLALSYLTEDVSQVKTAKKMFEKIISHSANPNLTAKIKMGIATCYDILERDWAVCASVIDSIDEIGLDPYLRDLVQVWKAKNLRDAGVLESAERNLGTLLARVSPQFHWHAYFSAKVVLGGVYLKQGRFDRLLDLINEVRSYCSKYPLRTVQRQIDYLAEQIKGEPSSAPLLWERSPHTSILSYEGKTIHLRGEHPWEKLLMLLMQEKVAPKTEIIEHLYQRKYRPKTDDKLIYSHIYSLKKNLLKIGLSEKTVVKEPVGYRWVPEVKVEEFVQ